MDRSAANQGLDRYVSVNCNVNSCIIICGVNRWVVNCSIKRYDVRNFIVICGVNCSCWRRTISRKKLFTWHWQCNPLKQQRSQHNITYGHFACTISIFIKSARVFFLIFCNSNCDVTFSNLLTNKMHSSSDKVLHCTACIAPIKTRKKTD